MSESGDPGVGYLFKVTIDGKHLGVFTKIAGINAKYDALPVKEGGENGFVHYLPGRVTYENIKLTRPVDGDSLSLAQWFSALSSNISAQMQTGRNAASITAFGPDGEAIVSWSFTGVFPLSYQGPSFQAGQSQILTETIELAHTGYLTERGSGEGVLTGASAPSNTSAARAANSAGQQIGGMFS
jgi:phage tail-like protein